jgi:hypothetical protein
MITTRTRKIAAALIALTLVGGIAASLPQRQQQPLLAMSPLTLMDL